MTSFTVHRRRAARCVALNETEPVWRLFYSQKRTFPGGESLGSYHATELFYVFNNRENASLGSGFLFKPDDDSMQKTLLSNCTHFAATGNPGTGFLPT